MKKYSIVLMSIISLAILSVVVYAAAQLSVTPSTVNAGNSITISVKPDVKGVYKYAWIYKDNTYKSSVAFPCSYYLCYSPTSTTFTVPSSWSSGSYNVRVYDYISNSRVMSYFTVTSSAPSSTCTDTDYGFNVYAKGTISGTNSNGTFSYTDYCVDSTKLREYTGDTGYPEVFDCSNTNSTKSCVNGACA